MSKDKISPELIINAVPQSQGTSEQVEVLLPIVAKLGELMMQ